VQIRVDDVVWREVGDELVVLELSTATYLNLNGTARHLWQLLVDGSTVQGLVDDLVLKYGISAIQAMADVEAFISGLSDRNLLMAD